MRRRWEVVWVAGALALGMGTADWARGQGGTETVAMATAPRLAAEEPAALTPGIEPVRAVAPEAEDPCRAAAVSQPSRPMWTAGAQTTQCGVMENDLGWHWMAVGSGVDQRGLTSTERYGITRWLDLTWSLPTRLDEAGEGEDPVSGITDQSVSAMAEFMQQRRLIPAMAVSYGVKIPTANPAKGFGSGFVDHQAAFLASRDVRALHFDFNLVGVMAGGPEGHNGAVQSGLVMAVPVRGNLGWMLETDGGSQPGTADRVGQSLTGLSWALRPTLVVDAAYTRGWTAGTPPQQFTAGVTWAHRLRPGLSQWMGR